jgi:hypothetical protein
MSNSTSICSLDDEQELSTSTSVRDSTAEKKKIARDESKSVNRVRFMVLTVLIMSGCMICFFVYFLSKRSVNDKIVAQFSGHAGQIQFSFHCIATEKLGAFGSIRVAAMVDAIDKNDTWPLVTMSSFEKRASVARRLSQCILIGIYPWVDNTTRKDFETYAAQVGPSMV